jgi:hypothetical protein
MTASLTKAMEKTSITLSHSPMEEPTLFPTLELFLKDEIEVFPEMLMVVLKTKQVNENDK